MENMRIELAGRYRLTSELLAAGLNVATPIFDDGIDLLAYRESPEGIIVRPIQLKASVDRAFAVDKKYERRSGLIMAYVWHVRDPMNAVTYAMTYEKAVGIAHQLGWTATKSWEGGKYVTNQPSAQVVQELEPHRMTGEKWGKFFAGAEV